MTAQSHWTDVASYSELKEKRRLVHTVNETEILLCLVAGDVIAVKNYCTHLGKPLDQGRIMAGQIHCPFHGACFDLKSGEAMSGPAVSPLKHFPVSLEGERILVQLDE